VSERGQADGAEDAVRVVLVSAPDETTAVRITRMLVQERLAACGNVVGGLTSIYWWQGAVETAAEALIVLKTSNATVDALVRRVPELHPYEVPEVLVVPVLDGHAPYLEWVRASCKVQRIED